MKRPTILVTGATGKTGRAVVEQLRRQDWPVRALVHRRDARSQALAEGGAEIVVADLHDPEQLLQAMRGTERAYFCPPMHPYMIQSATAFAVAASQARLESVVLLSQWLASPSHPSLLTRQTWLAERLLAMLPGVALTIVEPGFFADNYLRMTAYAAHLGIFPDIFGDSRNAPPSNEDIARVVVAALMDPTRHGAARYRPTGPELLSIPDMVAILSRVVGRKVRLIPMPRWMLLRAGRMQGSSAFEMAEFMHYLEDARQGAFEVGAPTRDVLDVTGHPAETFETTARRYADRPEAQRRPGPFLRALFDFSRTPLSPGYDLSRLEKGCGAPVPSAPRFAMDDDAWRVAHGAPRRSVDAAPAHDAATGPVRPSRPPSMQAR